MTMMSPEEALQFLVETRGHGLEHLYNDIIRDMGNLAHDAPGSYFYETSADMLAGNIARVSQRAAEMRSEAAGIDPAFGVAACDCQPGQPCCMKKGHVADAKDESRKVEWPVVTPPMQPVRRNLLVIAEEMAGANNIRADVKVWYEGKSCALSRHNTPGIATTNLVRGPDIITARSQQVSTGISTAPSVALVLSRLLPPDLVIVLAALDALFTVVSSARRSNIASFTPRQCFSDPAMLETLNVIPMPRLEIDGDATVALQLIFSTAGANAAFEATGSLTGHIANHELELKAEHKAVTGTAVRDVGREPAPGMVGVLASIIGAMDNLVARGNPARSRRRSLSAYSTRLVLSKSIALKPRAIELKAKSGSPDLELRIGGLDLELKVGVTGIVDIIDAFATGYGGAGAEAIRRARDMMARGENVSGKLDAYLELGAEGTSRHAIASAATIVIPANLPAASNSQPNEIFRGQIRIRGKLKLGIEIEAQVWIVKGTAGVSGTVHTSWVWSMRKQAEARQKKYEFEGLFVELEAYARVSRRRSSDDTGGPAISNNSNSSSSNNDRPPSDVARAVRDHLTTSKSTAEIMASTGVVGASRARSYTIFEPSDTGWQDY